MTTFTYTERLTVVHCTCGIAYAIPGDLNQQLLNHGRAKSVYCPLGHQWHYTESLEDALKRERQRHSATRDLLAAEERSHSATRGHLTRVKKRVSAGVCPCCNRTFQNVARHMQSKHPDYKPE